MEERGEGKNPCNLSRGTEGSRWRDERVAKEAAREGRDREKWKMIELTNTCTHLERTRERKREWKRKKEERKTRKKTKRHTGCPRMYMTSFIYKSLPIFNRFLFNKNWMRHFFT